MTAFNMTPRFRQLLDTSIAPQYDRDKAEHTSILLKGV
jgi:hypothetical protein